MQIHRYVVLHHQGFGEPHFDLMIEREADNDAAARPHKREAAPLPDAPCRLTGTGEPVTTLTR